MDGDPLERGRVYRMLGLLFAHPTAAAWPDVRAGLSQLPAAFARLGVPHTEIDEALRRLGAMELEELEPEYIATFSNGFPRAKAPPYGSLYARDRDRLREMADVRELYARCGLELSAGHGELPDHLAIELELLHYLCFQELSEPTHRATILEAQRTLLERHLGGLLNGLRGAVPDGLFAALIAATDDFVAADHRRLQEVST